MAQYPNALKPMAARLAGYSSQIRRIDPLGKNGDYRANQSAKFNIPSNATVDFRTLKQHLTASTFSKTADDGKGYVALPSSIRGLIDQILVYFNGVQVEATLNNWGFLSKMLDDFTVGREAREARKLLQNELMPGLDIDNEVFHRAATAKTDAAGTQTSLRAGYRDSNRKFVIDSFPDCFIGTVQCPVLNTSITGDIMIEFRFAPNSVLTVAGVKGKAPGAVMTDPAAYPPSIHLGKSKAVDSGAFPKQYADLATAAVDEAPPADAYYVIDDLYLTIKTIDIQDGHYYNWLASEVQRAPIELTYKHWEMQPGTMQASLNNNTRMTVNTACLDMLVGTFVSADNYNGRPVPLQDKLLANPEAVADTDYDGTWGNSHTGAAFHRGFVQSAGDTFRSQWSINNVDLGYAASLSDVFADLKEEWNLGAGNLASINPRIKNLKQFGQAFFAAPLRLNFKASTEDKDTQRYMSGLDCRGSTINIMWKTTGTLDGATNVTPLVYSQSTTIVQLKPGQVFEPIQ